MKLLIVEDDKTIALGLDYSLQQEGYSTILCHDVVAAKKALMEYKFNLCLFDLTLPDGSGYELCKLARERWETPANILCSSRRILQFHSLL